MTHRSELLCLAARNLVAFVIQIPHFPPPYKILYLFSSFKALALSTSILFAFLHLLNYV